MAWMRKARLRALNALKEELKRRPMTEYEAIIFLMGENWISEVTANRYLKELFMMGVIEKNNNKIKLKEEKRK